MPDLLNTSSVPLAPSASTTQTVLPDWYTNYAMGVLSNQQQAAATPYQPYQGPRVAGFTPDQEAGFAATEGAAGSYQPFTTAAGGALQQVQAGPTATAAASPYLAQADQTAPSQVQGYLNPYMSNVTDQIASLANQNLTNNILPAIGDEFVGAGGYGGSRDAQTIGKAIDTTQQNISQQQGAALAAGYNSSLTAAQADQARQAGLANTAGSLASTDTNNGIATAGALTNLGSATQSLGLNGANALQGIGAQQQALNQTNLTDAYNDYLTQQAYPQTQINNSTATLAGVKPAVDSSTLSQGYGPAPSGTTQSPSTLQAISAALAAYLGTQG